MQRASGIDNRHADCLLVVVNHAVTHRLLRSAGRMPGCHGSSLLAWRHSHPSFLCCWERQTR